MSLSVRERTMVEAAAMSAVANALLEQFKQPTLSSVGRYGRARAAVLEMIEQFEPTESSVSVLKYCAIEAVRQDLAIAMSLTDGLATGVDLASARSVIDFESFQGLSLDAASDASSLLHPDAASERAQSLLSDSLGAYFSVNGAGVSVRGQSLPESVVRNIAKQYSRFVIEDNLDRLRLGDPSAKSADIPLASADQDKIQALAIERDNLINEIALSPAGSSKEWDLLQQVKAIQVNINELEGSQAREPDADKKQEPSKPQLKTVHTQKELLQSLESSIVCLSDTDDVGQARHLFITRNQPFVTHIVRRPQMFESKSVTGFELQAFDLINRKMVGIRPDTFTGVASVVANLQPPAPGLELRDGHLILDSVEGVFFTHTETVNPPPYGVTYRAVSGMTADGQLKGVFPYYDLESRLPPPAEEADSPSMSL